GGGEDALADRRQDEQGAGAGGDQPDHPGGERARPPGRLARRVGRAQPMATATQVVVRVTPSMMPMDSVTRLPMASRVVPSTTAMKSYGPVTASSAASVARVPLT